MVLALSNFAWDKENDNLIFNKIKQVGFSNIECVLTKIKDWSELTTQDIIDYKIYLNNENIKPHSLQSLFYNVKCTGINDVEVIVNHFNRLIEYAKILDTKILVFGSPGLRKTVDGWENNISIIFKEVDKLLMGTDIIVVIEPNAPDYGGEFFHTVSEIVGFIKKYDFKNIKTMIDTHNLEMQDLNPTFEYLKNIDYISHIHVSERGLKEIIPKDSHYSLSDAMKKSDYKGIITYEVNKCENLLTSIEEFYKIYG